MAYGITHRFKDGTKEQYDAALEVVHPPDGLPEGQTHHFAGETEDGFIVIAIYDTKENFEKFRDETLQPGLQKVGDRGFSGPPEETGFEIHNEQHA